VRVVIRSTGGRTSVVRGQGLRGRPGDLTDSDVRRSLRCRVSRGVRRGMRDRVRHSGPCARVRHSGSGHAVGAGVGVRRGSSAGMRRRRYDAAYLHNVPGGIANSQRATGCLRTADGQSNAKHARGAGCDQLARCLHDDSPFIPAPRYRFAAITVSTPYELARRAR
jgi:hypothetical protein